MRTRRIRSPRRLSDKPLHVAPELIDREIASPARRALALFLDYLVLAVPVLAVAIGTAALSLRLQDPTGYRAVITLLIGHPSPAEAKVAWGEVASLLVHREMPGVPPEAAVAVEQQDPARAAEALAGYELIFALDFGEGEHPEPPEGSIRFEVQRLLPVRLRAVALFGVAAIYFTFFHAWGRGRTIGKRLMRIRVVQLGGERLSILESFERFAGCLEIPATMGLALLSFWRDPNRRLPHDRIANTAVVVDRFTSPPRAAAR